MAVKEHMRTHGLGLCDNDRIRAAASKPRLFSSAASHSAALAQSARIGGIGRTRGDFTQLEEPSQSKIEVSIDLAKTVSSAAIEPPCKKRSSNARKA
jgi:hypothetical protein